MDINIEGRNTIEITLDLISEIKIIFYEILNLYSLQQFYYKENFSIYNKILKLDENESKIIKNPDKLLSKLISDLTSLNIVLEELNSLPYINKTNNDSQEIITNEGNKFCYDINMFLMNNKMESKIYHNIFFFEDNIYRKLKEKELLIEKYFKKLKIKYSHKKQKQSSKEYIKIKIIVHNIFVILIEFPSNISLFYENDFEYIFKLKINGLFDSNNINIQLYKKLSKIIKSKFKQILKEMKEFYNQNYEVKISLLECFIQFFDYIYDYDKIFKIKCGKCSNQIKYISCFKFFSVPLLKIQETNENYKRKLINDIEKGNDINNINKIYNFFHEECINL